MTEVSGDIETMLDRRLTQFIFTMINHNNDVIKPITKFKLVFIFLYTAIGSGFG